MNLEEFVERVKIENNIRYDTEKLINYITDVARKKAKDNVAIMHDDEVKNLILNYQETDDKADDAKEEKKDIAKDEKNKKQISMFEL